MPLSRHARKNIANNAVAYIQRRNHAHDSPAVMGMVLLKKIQLKSKTCMPYRMAGGITSSEQ